MRNLALAALATLALSLAPAGSDAARPERSDSFVVTNVRVFDGLHVIPDATVVVRNGRIRAVGRHLDVPPNLPEIDGSGKTLMPGIIDSHGHARERRQLERAAQFGITTLMDMQSVNPFATQMYREQRRDEAHDRADFFSAINPATVEEGYPYSFTPDVETPTLDSPEEADEFVRRRIAEGSHHLKIFLEVAGGVGAHPSPGLDRGDLRRGPGLSPPRPRPDRARPAGRPAAGRGRPDRGRQGGPGSAQDLERWRGSRPPAGASVA